MRKRVATEGTDQSRYRSAFDKVDRDHDGFLNRPQFNEFCKELGVPANSSDKTLLAAPSKLSFDDVMGLIKRVQGDTGDKDNSNSKEKEKDKGTPKASAAQPPTPTPPKAAAQISKKASVLDRLRPAPGEIDRFANVKSKYQPKSAANSTDMTAPLTHYLILGSHNTCLAPAKGGGGCFGGKQREVSIKRLTDILDRGCRAIHLEVMSGSSHPVISYGNSKGAIGASQCFAAIKQHAFKSSTFPLVISLNIFCNENNCAQLARIITTELGSSLATQGSVMELSPRDLKGKIIIRDCSTRRPKPKQATNPSTSANNTTSNTTNNTTANTTPSTSAQTQPPPSPPAPAETQQNTIVAAPAKVKASSLPKPPPAKGRLAQTPVPPPASTTAGSTPTKPEPAKRNVPPPVTESPVELERLFNLVACKWEDLDSPGTANVNDSYLDSFIANHQNTLKLTQKHLVGVHPATKGGVFNIACGWSVGIQINSANWHVSGVGLAALQGLFLDNGGCGYLKKPSWMLESAPSSYDDLTTTRTLGVRILGARGLGARHASPFSVVLYVFGIPSDVYAERTSAALGINVCAWDEGFQFSIKVPELAVLVLDLNREEKTKDQSIGIAALPVNNIPAGQFVVPLTAGGERSDAVLLVELTSTAVQPQKKATKGRLG